GLLERKCVDGAHGVSGRSFDTGTRTAFGTPRGAESSVVARYAEMSEECLSLTAALVRQGGFLSSPSPSVAGSIGNACQEQGNQLGPYAVRPSHLRRIDQ